LDRGDPKIGRASILTTFHIKIQKVKESDKNKEEDGERERGEEEERKRKENEENHDNAEGALRRSADGDIGDPHLIAIVDHRDTRHRCDAVHHLLPMRGGRPSNLIASNKEEGS